MRHTAKFRTAVQAEEWASALTVGKYTSDHVSLPDNIERNIVSREAEIEEVLQRFECTDGWHRRAILEIFASELVTGMSNNIADYVWQELLPYRYSLNVLPRRHGRNVSEIKDYIRSFSNSSNLLKHIFAAELKQHVESSANAEEKTLVLQIGKEQKPLSLREVVDVMLSRAEVRNCGSHSTDPLEAIIDTAFAELLFALRQIGQTRFSISSLSDHTVALTSAAANRNEEVISKIRASERRLTHTGEVVPSWREYLALSVTFFASAVVLTLAITLNWAQRKNFLERIFDGVGLFGIASGIMLALISRRLDFFDLIGIILRRKRYLASYAELLRLLGICEEELKSALTFEGVRVPPVATSYSFEEHNGIFDTRRGLNSNAKDINTIIGNKTAIARGAETVLYFEVVQTDATFYLSRRNAAGSALPDAMYRIVTSGNEKMIR